MDQKTISDSYWQKNADDFAIFYKTKWTDIWKNSVSQFLEQRTRKLLDYAVVSPRTKMLDIGCGHGVHMKSLLPRLNHSAGLDYSPKMINLAKKELSDFPRSKWSLKVGDAHRLPYPKNSFDLVIAMGLLDYVKNPTKVINEAARVLKSKGVFVFTIPKNPSLFWFLRTSTGNMIKNKLFHLPPIINIVNYEQLFDLVGKSQFQIEQVSSVWTTMWIVKAVKK